MLTDVYLHGEIGSKYGHRHAFDIANAKQAARALACNYRGFEQDFRTGTYRVLLGDIHTGHELDVDSLDFRVGTRPVHIIPVAAGAGGRGGGKAIVGVALLAVATGGAAAAGLP